MKNHPDKSPQEACGFLGPSTKIDPPVILLTGGKDTYLLYAIVVVASDVLCAVVLLVACVLHRVLRRILRRVLSRTIILYVLGFLFVFHGISPPRLIDRD